MERAVRTIAWVLTVLMLVAAACTSENAQAQQRVQGQEANAPHPPPTPAVTPVSGQAQVLMQHNAFNPDAFRVKVGTTVTWKNMDNSAHTVMSGDRAKPSGVFSSGQVQPGATWSYTFNQDGSFPYFCENHQGMDAMIVVEK